MIEFVVPGKATGKGRAKFSRASGHAYTPAQTVSAEQRIQAAWHAAGQPRLPDGPASLTMTVVVARPKNHWKADGTLSLAGQRAPWPVRKPDFDNAQKLIADALNGCAYRDDVVIVHSWFVRRWANPHEHEHTTITLAPMPAYPAVSAAA